MFKHMSLPPHRSYLFPFITVCYLPRMPWCSVLEP